MSLTKLAMAVLLIWLVPVSFAPLFDTLIMFPFSISLVEEHSFFEQRTLAVRSAAYMTISYFIVSYFRHQRSQSSLLPILVYSVWLIFFRVALLIIHGGGDWVEWLIIVFFILLAGLLWKANKEESSKIFKGSW